MSEGNTVTMLSGLQTAELTLTKKGANGRVFAITKSEGYKMDECVISAVASTPAQGEEDLVEMLKSNNSSEDEIGAAVVNYRIQTGFKDLVSDEMFEQVSKAAGYSKKGEGKMKKEVIIEVEGEGEDDEEEMMKTKGKEKMNKSNIDLNQLDDATRQQVESVFKSNQDLAKETQELKEVVKSMRDEAQRKEYIAKAAESYSHVPMDPEELGLLLKNANEISEGFGKKFEELLGKVQESVSKSALLDTVGKSQQNDPSAGAWDKIEEMAKSLVQKSQGLTNLTQAQAIDRVLKSEEGQSLYQEYLGENPRQTGLR